MKFIKNIINRFSKKEKNFTYKLSLTAEQIREAFKKAQEILHEKEFVETIPLLEPLLNRNKKIIFLKREKYPSWEVREKISEYLENEFKIQWGYSGVLFYHKDCQKHDFLEEVPQLEEILREIEEKAKEGITTIYRSIDLKTRLTLEILGFTVDRIWDLDGEDYSISFKTLY